MAALNTEEENYVRISLLLTGIAPRAVRCYFDQLFPPVDLASTFSRMYTQLHDLKRFRKVINQTQWNLLFPHNGVPDSKTFDVTLMICLIRNLMSIPQPQNGYDRLPLATELFPAADLARIKYYRNYLAHIDDGNIDTTYYNSAWTQITDALGRLGGSSVHQECHELKTKILDQSNQEVMLEVRHLKQSLDTIETSLDTIETSHDNLKSSHDNLKASHGNLKASYDTLKASHSAMEIEWTTLQTTCVAMETELTTLQKAQKDTIPWNIREQIKQKLETWKKTDETFVETRAAVDVLTSLKENSCVTVTGSSGVGKSATVHHVALQMEKDGYELVPITDPCKIVEFYNPEQSTLFIIDDFCGTFSTNQTVLDTLKAKIKDLEHILETNKAKVIVTCRHQVYKDERLKAIPLFQSCECDLQSESTCLLPKERKSIATAYLGTDALKINQYMELYEFFPLLCALYKSNTTLEMTEFFKNPFSVYQAEIDKLYTDGAYGKYCCLALCVVFNNNVKEEWFTGEVNKEIQTIIENTLEACKMMRGTPRLLLKDELDSLIHTFLKNENGIYKTIHDKLFDFLSFYFGTKMIQILIKNAYSLFIRERFLYDRMNESDQYKIFIPDSHKKMYIERMFNDWQNGKVVDVFCNTNMKVLSFREQFKSYLSSLSVSYQTQLAHKSDVDNNDTVFIQCCFIGDVDLVQWCFSHGVNVISVEIIAYHLCLQLVKTVM